VTSSPTPVVFPADRDGWLAFVGRTADRIARVGAIDEQLKADPGLSVLERLHLWNEAEILFREARAAQFLSEVHPDAGVRAAAEAQVQAADTASSARLLDPALWRVFADASDDALDPLPARVLRFLRRDFRRGGVHLDDEVRERVQALAERDTELSLAFSRNVREGRREIRVAPGALAGLPQDFVDEHPADAEGLVTLTTEYPDLLPVLDYATDRETRMAILREFYSIGWPENVPVLTELLQLRAERAALLGFADWADYETETRMIGSGAAIPVFLDGVDEASRAPAQRQYEVVRERLRREVPDADLVTMADLWYLIGAVKREQFDVDAKLLRSYFPFERVVSGVLDTVGRLLDLAFVSADVTTWHEDVRSYDVVREGSLLGRIHLDMHPRDGKFSHAACFALVPGIAGRTVPEGALACNFSRGLLDHEDVLTFFHEFGHLVHFILSGHGEWAKFGAFQTEWDFVEAPSQLLEEWAWDADVLASFTAGPDGAPIPAELAARMRVADGFGRALGIRRQLGYARTSYGLHVDLPDDLQAATEDWFDSSSPVKLLPGLHPYAGFGHLTDYGACYYTYEWSQVIARDLLSAFGDDLMNAEVAGRYRREILERGGSRDASEMVEAFLGRPYSFDAYAEWLAGD
jgi:thimet oligopeptidase